MANQIINIEYKATDFARFSQNALDIHRRRPSYHHLQNIDRCLELTNTICASLEIECAALNTLLVMKATLRVFCSLGVRRGTLSPITCKLFFVFSTNVRAPKRHVHVSMRKREVEHRSKEALSRENAELYLIYLYVLWSTLFVLV